MRADDDARNETLDHLVVREISSAFRTELHPRANRLHDEPLQRGSRHTRDAARVLLAALKEKMGHVVAISHTILVGMAGRHPVAAVIEDASHQDCRRGC
jgi:hypothetical protein